VFARIRVKIGSGGKRALGLREGKRKTGGGGEENGSIQPGTNLLEAHPPHTQGGRIRTHLDVRLKGAWGGK